MRGIKRVAAGHWRAIAEGGRYFEMWAPRDTTADELRAFVEAVIAEMPAPASEEITRNERGGK